MLRSSGKMSGRPREWALPWSLSGTTAEKALRARSTIEQRQFLGQWEQPPSENSRRKRDISLLESSIHLRIQICEIKFFKATFGQIFALALELEEWGGGCS